MSARVPTPSTQTDSRAILSATALLSVSALVGIVAGIVRHKSIAVELGPEGFGVLGQLGTFLTLAATVAGLGLAQSGVKGVASVRAEGGESVARTGGALVWAGHVLGVVGAALTLFLPLEGILGPQGSVYIPWLAIGVWVSVASVGHSALANGLGRLRALAWVSALGSTLSAAVTVVAVRESAEAGIIAALVSGPVLGLAGAVWAGRARLEPIRTGLRHWRVPLRTLLGLGIAFMASAILGAGMHFVTRVLVSGSLGVEAAGLYHASWSIAALYLGFLLSSLGIEYYPRISAVHASSVELAVAVRAQARLVMDLTVPLVVAAIVLAPTGVRLLYDVQFEPMLPMLRAQLAGDVLKVGSWALAFSLMATGRQGLYFIAEALFCALYIGAVVWVVPRLGLVSAGWAYTLCYLLYSGTVLIFVRGYVPSLGGVAARAAAYTTACVAVAWVCQMFGEGFGAAVAVLPVGAAVHSLWRTVQGDSLPTPPFLRRVLPTHYLKGERRP